MRVAVCGAGGAIGGHLVARLLADGHEVVASDRKPKDRWWQWHYGAENLPGYDLAAGANAVQAIDGCAEVYHLACDMGGISFIENNRYRCMNSTAINLAVLNACANLNDPVRVFYSSSACVYPTDLQAHPGALTPALREEDAYPSRPEPGYGEEKLYGEALCASLNAEPFGVTCRVARYHNVFGPPGSWDDGREKAPAAICRKVAEAKLSGSGRIDVWGDGSQTRSYLYVSDAVDGTLAVMGADYDLPLNVGSDRQVSVDDLVSIVEVIAGVTLRRHYQLDAPRGVAGRNADLARVKAYTGWEPKVSLEDGLERTFRWIYDQLAG